ncbi:MAG: DUF3427 domain-containing protein [Sandaracinaceae bacterium]|nr:DUF3427 domain-containing protein [Sandaracinaceae bacterium]
MSVFRRKPTLSPGIYEEIVTDSLEQRLSALSASHAVVRRDLKSTAGVDELLVSLIRDAAQVAIGASAAPADKLATAQRILASLSDHASFRQGEVALQPQVLRAIERSAALGKVPVARPRASLLGSRLITNAPDESIVDHLRSEFESADRIDLLCAFVKLSGLEKFRSHIERHLDQGRPLRVLTTTYMRASEAKAIELLQRLGADVRVSYDDTSTRLHAKAWIFHRDSEYGTAYVGSSNLSHAAQTDGLEWNVRIAQAEQPQLHASMVEVFESYFRNHDGFEAFDGSELARRRLARALVERPRTGASVRYELEPRSWQRPILRELVEARSAGQHKNLVVAATGTGKTLISAFDYRDACAGGAPPSLLFVAHRREILDQARRVFGDVLGRETFGELWVDGQPRLGGKHVFASIQTLTNATDLAADAFEWVVVDEVHHAAARTYDALLTHLRPRELVGLTATPERADGRLYDAHFPRPYIGNLRVWDAIAQQVLVPFRYFVLDVDGLDLRDAAWRGGYVDADLSTRLVTAADCWVRATVKALGERIARPETVRALAFCVDKAHARVVAERLTRDAGLQARALTDETPREERLRAKDDLREGAVQVLCVVDLFNEGVDIPDVNTLFLYRPTESSTVFLQQLGRGLRRHPTKDMLTVFDLTGRQHPSFRADRNLRALLGHTQRELRDFVDSGFGRLPSGCTIQFEERAQREILERIAASVPTDVKDLRRALRDHADENWDLATFLHETEADVYDLYRAKRSWTSLRADVGLVAEPVAAYDKVGLPLTGRLLHVRDALRLGQLERLLRGERPTTVLERRLASMLLVVLFENFEARELSTMLDHFDQSPALRDELSQLLPVLRAMVDRLPRNEPLRTDVPLVLHAEYYDIELSAAFNAISKEKRTFRHFYTGVEKVDDGRHDLLLVTLDKGDQEHEHLRYHDLPLSPTVFQWQSQAATRLDDEKGRRHTTPHTEGVVPLLFVRERAKDQRGMTVPFRYLGPVTPASHRGERPITVEWELSAEIPPELFRHWTR